MSILKRKPRIAYAADHWGESQAAMFHEHTKYSELGLFKTSPRIMEYMTSSKYILETVRNYKEYLAEKSLPLLPPQSLNLDLQHLFAERRSCHDYSKQAVSYQELSNLLGWAAGVTKTIKVNKPGVENETMSARSYPSGGGLYPCETYIIALNVERLEQGVYHYNNRQHALDPISQNLNKHELERIFLADNYIDDIAFIVVVTSVFERQVTKYGDRAYRLALIESGHLMQNILLSATAQDMASLSWGGYHDNEVASLLQTNLIGEPPIHTAFVGKRDDK